MWSGEQTYFCVEARQMWDTKAEKNRAYYNITLMNWELDRKPPLNQDNLDKKHPNYFSVQSENHIWWLGLFEVCKL